MYLLGIILSGFWQFGVQCVQPNSSETGWNPGVEIWKIPRSEAMTIQVESCSKFIQLGQGKKWGAAYLAFKKWIFATALFQLRSENLHFRIYTFSETNRKPQNSWRLLLMEETCTTFKGLRLKPRAPNLIPSARRHIGQNGFVRVTEILHHLLTCHSTLSLGVRGYKLCNSKSKVIEVVQDFFHPP